MDALQKLLKKISKKDRQRLLSIIQKLLQGDVVDLQIKKIKNSDLYRVRSGRFRIIFHYEGSSIIIDSVILRNEYTYR